MPELGQILYVKTTEEPTSFQGERKAKWYEPYPKGTVLYRVRRPQVVNGGAITYKFAVFTSLELETEAEQTQRLYQKFKQRQMLASEDSHNGSGPLNLNVS